MSTSRTSTGSGWQISISSTSPVSIITHLVAARTAGRVLCRVPVLPLLHPQPASLQRHERQVPPGGHHWECVVSEIIMQHNISSGFPRDHRLRARRDGGGGARAEVHHGVQHLHHQPPHLQLHTPQGMNEHLWTVVYLLICSRTCWTVGAAAGRARRATTSPSPPPRPPSPPPPRAPGRCGGARQCYVLLSDAVLLRCAAARWATPRTCCCRWATTSAPTSPARPASATGAAR